jgi:hypothetical protein
MYNSIAIGEKRSSMPIVLPSVNPLQVNTTAARVVQAVMLSVKMLTTLQPSKFLSKLP